MKTFTKNFFENYDRFFEEEAIPELARVFRLGVEEIRFFLFLCTSSLIGNRVCVRNSSRRRYWPNFVWHVPMGNKDRCRRYRLFMYLIHCLHDLQRKNNKVHKQEDARYESDMQEFRKKTNNLRDKIPGLEMPTKPYFTPVYYSGPSLWTVLGDTPCMYFYQKESGIKDYMRANVDAIVSLNSCEEEYLNEKRNIVADCSGSLAFLTFDNEKLHLGALNKKHVSRPFLKAPDEVESDVSFEEMRNVCDRFRKQITLKFENVLWSFVNPKVYDLEGDIEKLLLSDCDDYVSKFMKPNYCLNIYANTYKMLAYICAMYKEEPKKRIYRIAYDMAEEITEIGAYACGEVSDNLFCPK